MKLLLVRAIALLARILGSCRAEYPPRRVLLIKPDHLGDLLLATPALAALRLALPRAQLTGLVGPWARQIWARSPALDALETLPFPGFERAAPAGRRPPLAALRPYLLLAKYALLLRRRGYDAALILRDDHWWGAALAALAGIPRRIGHAHPLCAPLLSDALPYDPREHVGRQALALVGRLAEGGRGTGGQGDKGTSGDPVRGGGEAAPLSPTPPLPAGAPPLRFAPPPADVAWAAAWLADKLPPHTRLVVLHPGTGGPTKHWIEERWAAVADALSAEPGIRLLLTGGPDEAALVGRVAGLMRRPPLTLAGKTSLGQLAALLGRADLVLGVDSGPLHIAVSQGAPTLHLYGPSDHQRFGPWGDPARQVVLRAGLFCSPCGSFSHCPRGTAGPECMDLIGADEVLAAARRLLES